MSHMFRTITWTAEHCRHTEIEVYLGLAPGLEDNALQRTLGGDALVSHGSREVPIASNGHAGGTVPLRLYAMRDARHVRVERCQDRSSLDGFQRVRLQFQVKECPRAAHGAKSGADNTVPPVVAFLITIGLTADEEAAFFSHVVNDFLVKSWSSLPTLLRELGCTAAPEAA